MPLLYGEGVKAFQRLQEEIMKRSDDHSILAWAQIEGSDVVQALLAPSPAHFEKKRKHSTKHQRRGIQALYSNESRSTSRVSGSESWRRSYRSPQLPT
jgi:hypothetical protein